MIRKVYTLFISALFVNTLIAQTITVKGKITDSNTNLPLSFATIELKKASTGTYSDTAGFFSLKISEKYLNDSIEIYALGYRKKKVAINQLNNRNTDIKLIPKDYKIKEVKVKAKNVKLVKLGIRAKKPWKYQIANVFGSQIAQLIRNESNIQGFVESVSFYIAEVGHTDTPFRVRIYKYNPKNNCPGEDLLNENLIVQNMNGAGWFSVDLSDYFIRFPEEGMFVAMEWVYTGDKYYYLHEISMKQKDGTQKNVNDRFYGQSLGNLYKQKKICTWSKGLGNKWVIWDSYYKGYINMMINAVIEAEK